MARVRTRLPVAGQLDAHRRPAARRRLGPDAPAVRLDDGARDCQAEAGAAAVARAGHVQSPHQGHRRLVPALGIALAVEQLDLSVQHRQRRSQLVRCIRDEVALAGEAPSRRSSIRSKAVASTPTSPLAPTVPARNDRSPASTAAATADLRRNGRAISVAISTPAAPSAQPAAVAAPVATPDVRIFGGDQREDDDE